MSNVPLPQPRMHQPKIKFDENHGLWGFFPAKGQAFWKPSETEEYGRAWTVEELRKKAWPDLHALWWVCCKERNMLATSRRDLIRAKVGFGEREIQNRDDEIRRTMRNIKHALTERYYTWQDAVMVAEQDPEINLEGGKGNIYNPVEYNDSLLVEEMDEEFSAEEAQATAAREAAAKQVQAEQAEQPQKIEEAGKAETPVQEQPAKTPLH